MPLTAAHVLSRLSHRLIKQNRMPSPHRLMTTLLDSFKEDPVALSRTQGTGLPFKDFFSSVTKGTFGKSLVPFHPHIELPGHQDAILTRTAHSGNFDDHINKSIPTFYESQIGTAHALSKLPHGSHVLDIGASEGSFGKSISQLSNGHVKTTSLDPNLDMAHHFATSSTVPGADYSTDAFGGGFHDGEREVPSHNPKHKYDAIHEAMAFQFMDSNRHAQVQEVLRHLKPGGLFITSQKFRTKDWDAHERLKDSGHKNKYFTQDELKQKQSKVGFSQSPGEEKAVGMVDNMVPDSLYEHLLKQHFKHVVQHWDAGNFKGYVASDDGKKIGEFLRNMPPLNSKFSANKTPRVIKDPVAKLARATPETYATAKPTTTAGPGKEYLDNGVNKSRVDSTHFYKQSRNPHTERAIAVGMRLLGAPASTPYRVLQGNGQEKPGVVSSPLMSDIKPLREHNAPIDFTHAPHTLASEWLMNVTDRHGENYVVDQKTGQPRSIDYGVGWDLFRHGDVMPSVPQTALYKRMPGTPKLPAEHVDRAIKAAPHIRKLMARAMAADGIPAQHIKAADAAFTKRLAHIVALRDKHGASIPLSELHN